MSDLILKIFPSEEVDTDKTTIIREQLAKSNFLSGQEIEFHGEHYLEPGSSFCNYFLFEKEPEAIQSYKKEIRIQVAPNSSLMTMKEGDEEPVFLDRTNVVEIWNADNNYVNWEKLTSLLQQITGDAYRGEWEKL